MSDSPSENCLPLTSSVTTALFGEWGVTVSRGPGVNPAPFLPATGNAHDLPLLGSTAGLAPQKGWVTCFVSSLFLSD